MKFIHLSDLHLGKRLEEFPLLQDQEYILNEILTIIKDEKPDGILIAGDIYDRSVPPTEALSLFETFLVNISRENLSIFIIGGNHDSIERLSYCREFFKSNQIYISPSYQGHIEPITLKKQDEEVDIYLLPFIKPIQMRKFFPEKEILTYQDAVSTAIEEMNIPKNRCSILVTHQFVTGATLCESEEISVGGSENIDANTFDSFDYVALGHLHGPQNVGSEKIHYCGSPLKFSFSEVNHKKTVTVVEVGSSFQQRRIPLTPLFDMIEIKGPFQELISTEFSSKIATDSYIRATLTDENSILDAMAQLRTVYPKILKLKYDNLRTNHDSDINNLVADTNLGAISLFSALFQEQNGRDFSDIEKNYLEDLVIRLKEADV